MDTPLDCEAIIAGVDQAGAHVFVVEDPGVAISCDLAGWAAIGSGYRHANAQFMAARYSRFVEFPESFLLTYLAKKKADITPGVGLSTDMFWIGQEGYLLLTPSDPIVGSVDKLYKKSVAAEDSLKNRSLDQIREFVRKTIVEQTRTEEVRPTFAEDATGPQPPIESRDQEQGGV